MGKVIEAKKKQAEEERKARVTAAIAKAAALAKKKEEDAKKSVAEALQKAGEDGDKKIEDAPDGEDKKPEEEVKKEDGDKDGKAEEKKEDAMEDVKTEDVKEEEKKDDVKKEEKEEVKTEEATEETKKEEEEEEEPRPIATLTEEEMKSVFRTPEVKDILTNALNASFMNFELPSKDEGFVEIQYEWGNEAASKAYFRNWMLEKKRTTRIEDIQPSEEFSAKFAAWQKVLQEWQMKQKDWKQNQKTREEAKAKAKALKKKEKDPEAKGSISMDVDKEGDKEAEKEEENEEPVMDVDEEDEDDKKKVLTDEDIFSVADVADIGGGEPLFVDFGFEDWALSSLRFELDLLVKYFVKDLNDPDRPAIPELHFAFYYNKYFKKQLNTRFFGTQNIAELFNLIQDTIGIENDIVVRKLTDEQTSDFSLFVKLAEDSRRERQRRIDAGDESVKLKFSVLAAPPQAAASFGGATPKSQGIPVVGTAAPKAAGGATTAKWQSMGGLRPTIQPSARPKSAGLGWNR